MGQIPQQMFDWLQISSLYALIAMGLTLVYALSGIVNFAQADVMMIGGYAALVANGLGFPIAGLVAIVVTVVLGIILERCIFRFTLSRPINGFIVSLGLIALFENAVAAHWSTNPQSIRPEFSGVVKVSSTLRLPTERILTLVVSALLLAVFFLVLHRSRWGRALRAMAENHAAAQLMGIRAGAYRMGALAIGSGMAGVAGVLIAAQSEITPDIGASYIIYAFAVVIVGGLGNTTGMIVGSLVVGAIETFTPGSVIPNQWEPVVALGVITVMLLLRPQGLFRGIEGAELR